MKKNNLSWFFLVICLISFIIPFLIKDNQTTILNTLSVSFTALSSIATVSTLIIAVLLYQKFSIDTVLIERQTNKVLELIDLLKGNMVRISFDKYIYYSRFNIDEESLFQTSFYREMAGMALITRIKDFNQFVGKIVDISNSYWIPEEIKVKMEFLKITGFFNNIEPTQIKSYAKLIFLDKICADDEWCLITPNLKEFRTDFNEVIKIEEAELLVNDYITSKNVLIKTIIKWLEENSNIKLDLKLNEPNQSIYMK